QQRRREVRLRELLRGAERIVVGTTPGITSGQGARAAVGADTAACSEHMAQGVACSCRNVSVEAVSVVVARARRFGLAQRVGAFDAGFVSEAQAAVQLAL